MEISNYQPSQTVFNSQATELQPQDPSGLVRPIIYVAFCVDVIGFKDEAN